MRGKSPFPIKVFVWMDAILNLRSSLASCSWNIWAVTFCLPVKSGVSLLLGVKYSSYLCSWSSKPDYSQVGIQTTADNNYLFMLRDWKLFSHYHSMEGGCAVTWMTIFICHFSNFSHPICSQAAALRPSVLSMPFQRIPMTGDGRATSPNNYQPS